MASSKAKHSKKVNVGTGWFSRQSLAFRVVFSALLSTLAVMAIVAAVVGWQSQNNARAAVQSEMESALSAVDQSLQLVFRSASRRASDLMPTFIDALGGEPTLGDSDAFTGEIGYAPRIMAGGITVNGDTAVLEEINRMTGADPAIIVKVGDKWARAATLLKDDNGQPRIGSVIPADDFTVRTLSEGQDYTGLVQRNGQWYAIAIRSLVTADGKVFGGLTVRVNVDADVQNLLAWAARKKWQISVRLPSLKSRVTVASGTMWPGAGQWPVPIWHRAIQPTTRSNSTSISPSLKAFHALPCKWMVAKR